MKKFYFLLALITSLFINASGQTAGTATCTANFEWSDQISYNPFSHSLNFTAIPGNSTNTTNTHVLAVCWTFGDGTQACKQAIPGTTNADLLKATHVYPPSSSPLATYNVCVKIYYDGGCMATACKTINLQYPSTPATTCAADYSTGPISSTPLGRTFTAIPQNSSNKKPLEVCWIFNDGTPNVCKTYAATYTGTYTAEHVFPRTGQFEVCVSISYDGDCVARKCKVVSIEQPATCAAGLTVTSMASNSMGRVLTAVPSHSLNKKPVSICWKFGDGSPDVCKQYGLDYTGTYAVEHTYANGGQYEACVVIHYDGGCESRKCEVVNVNAPTATCTAGFTVNPVSATPMGRIFTPVFTNSLQRKPVRICWTFGDAPNPTPVCKEYPTNYTGSYATDHVYQHGGQYQVCVKITYDGGCESYKCETITVTEPTATCTADLNITTMLSNVDGRVLTAIPANSLNKKPVYICWKFGDGTPDVCKQYGTDHTGPYAVEHVYAHAGQYEACVTIKYDGGCESRKCKIVSISDECKVNLYEAAASVTNLERKLYIGLMDGRAVQSICWNYGDGSPENCTTLTTAPTQASLMTSHKFPGPGSYKVCVKVVYANGCIATKCLEVNVRPIATNSCGGYMTDKATERNTIKFNGFSISNPGDQVLSYNWTFGDGTSGSGAEISHTYATPGNYQVCLLIRTTSGCETRICKKVSVEGNAQPQLTLSPNPVTTVLHVSFFSLRPETVNVRIYNANGLVIRNYVRNVVAGNNTWDIPDVGTLPTGVYSVVLQSPTQFANAIFFKQ